MAKGRDRNFTKEDIEMARKETFGTIINEMQMKSTMRYHCTSNHGENKKQKICLAQVMLNLGDVVTVMPTTEEKVPYEKWTHGSLSD